MNVFRVTSPGKADYTNWLAGNAYVAWTFFGDQATEMVARSMLESRFPDREVHMLDAST